MSRAFMNAALRGFAKRAIRTSTQQRLLSRAPNEAGHVDIASITAQTEEVLALSAQAMQTPNPRKGQEILNLWLAEISKLLELTHPDTAEHQAITEQQKVLRAQNRLASSQFGQYPLPQTVKQHTLDLRQWAANLYPSINRTPSGSRSMSTSAAASAVTRHTNKMRKIKIQQELDKLQKNLLGLQKKGKPLLLIFAALQQQQKAQIAKQIQTLQTELKQLQTPAALTLSLCDC